MQSASSFHIRAYRPADLPALAQIYSGSIRHLGSAHYSPEQVAAWSSFPDDIERFRRWIEDVTTLVATDGQGQPLGFGGLDAGVRISAVFVAPAQQRRGIASALLTRLLEAAKAGGATTVTSEASEFSRPLFERFGFSVHEIEYTEFKGVRFSRYAMRLHV